MKIRIKKMKATMKMSRQTVLIITQNQTAITTTTPTTTEPTTTTTTTTEPTTTTPTTTEPTTTSIKVRGEIKISILTVNYTMLLTL